MCVRLGHSAGFRPLRPPPHTHQSLSLAGTIFAGVDHREPGLAINGGVRSCTMRRRRLARCRGVLGGGGGLVNESPGEWMETARERRNACAHLASVLLSLTSGRMDPFITAPARIGAREKRGGAWEGPGEEAEQVPTVFRATTVAFAQGVIVSLLNKAIALEGTDSNIYDR